MNRPIFATLFVVCAALPVLAAELEVSASGETEYDDNFFRTPDHKKDDVLFRLHPGVRVHEDRGDDLNFSVGYELPVEFSTQHASRGHDVDHVGIGTFDYHVNDQLSFNGSEQYSYLRSTLRNQPVLGTDTSDLSAVPQFSDQRDQVKLNNATLGADYHFSPRMVGRVEAVSSFFDSTRHDRSKVWSAGGSAETQYRYSRNHQLGAGAGYTYQNFDDRQDIPGSETHTYRLFGTWRWSISETTALDISAGPAYLNTKQDDAGAKSKPTFPFFATQRGLSAEEASVFRNKSGNPYDPNVDGPAGPGSVLTADINNCATVDGFPVAAGCAADILIPVTDPIAGTVSNAVTGVSNNNASGKDDSDFTGLVDATLSHHWTPTLATALRYARQQGDASGLGGTVIEDAFSLSNTWEFAERWQLAFRGDFVHRKSAFDLAQTYDVVAGTVPAGCVGCIPFAGRTGVAFNSKTGVEIDTDSWAVAGRITHQLFRTTSIYVQARYSEQNSDSNSLGVASDFENFLATFGVRHVFEPIPLW
jgi:hypothetical protein